MCFDPHHALRIIFEGHTYNFLLCNTCNVSLIFEDDKIIATLGASGFTEVINGFLAAAHIPPSDRSDPDYLPKLKARAEKGIAGAQAQLGYIYNHGGDGYVSNHGLFNSNIGAAVGWYRKAA